MICDYGCGQEAEFYFKQAKKWCCSKNFGSCPEMRKRKCGKNAPFFSKHHLEKTIEKMRQAAIERLSKNPHPRTGVKHKEESIEKMRKSHKGHIPWNKGKHDCFSTKTLEKLSELARIQCFNGHAIHMNSCIKDDSKPENELFILSCKLLPKPIHKFPIYRGRGKRNYTVDIADSSIGIILEFDGHYHFNTEEAIERDKRRQKEIEEDGWKFLRYNIFQPFPTLEQVKEDVKELLNL